MRLNLVDLDLVGVPQGQTTDSGLWDTGAGKLRENSPLSPATCGGIACAGMDFQGTAEGSTQAQRCRSLGTSIPPLGDALQPLPTGTRGREPPLRKAPRAISGRVATRLRRYRKADRNS